MIGVLSIFVKVFKKKVIFVYVILIIIGRYVLGKIFRFVFVFLGDIVFLEFGVF